MCSFRAGQRVVALKSNWSNLFGIEDERVSLPQKGTVYTVSAVVHFLDETFIRLLEFEDTHFLSDHFRPVVGRKTDISVFKAMLTTSKVEELA